LLFFYRTHKKTNTMRAPQPLPLLLLVLVAAATATDVVGARPQTARTRTLASSDGHEEAWTGEGLFLPAELTERDVLVDGLLPGEQVGKEDVWGHSGGGEGGNGNENDKAGTIGRIFAALLRRARAQERATPNVGGSSNAFTRVEGNRAAQRRNATVVLSSGPLNAASLGTAGAAAVAPAGSLARADARAGASTFANATLSDHNDDPKDFAAAGSARGSTVAVGGGTRAAGAQTVLGTASAAGEQAAQGRAGLGIGPFLVLFNLGTRDGAQQNGGAGSVGIGDRASTRLQVAGLADGRKSEQQVEPEQLPKPEREQEEQGKGELRTSSNAPPSPSPSPKPPGPIAKHTSKKREKMDAGDEKRKAKKAEKEGKNPADAAIVEGRLSERCPDGEDEQGSGNNHQQQQQQCNDRSGYRGGSALRAWADSADSPGLSTTGAGIADVNVRAGLTSEAAANRYGYSRGISTGSASATGTRAARARLASMSFGTGYTVQSSAATARVTSRAEGGKDDEKEKEKEKEGQKDGDKEEGGGGGTRR
jgi:hypothetical protein